MVLSLSYYIFYCNQSKDFVDFFFVGGTVLVFFVLFRVRIPDHIHRMEFDCNVK